MRETMQTIVYHEIGMTQWFVKIVDTNSKI